MTDNGIPKFVVVVLAVAIAGLVAAGAVFIYVADYQRDEKAATCHRSVDGRDDNRAMWLYLVNKNPSVSRDELVVFVWALNFLLPPQKCVDSVPVEDEKRAKAVLDAVKRGKPIPGMPTVPKLP